MLVSTLYLYPTVCYLRNNKIIIQVLRNPHTDFIIAISVYTPTTVDKASSFHTCSLEFVFLVTATLTRMRQSLKVVLICIPQIVFFFENSLFNFIAHFS